MDSSAAAPPQRYVRKASPSAFSPPAEPARSPRDPLQRTAEERRSYGAVESASPREGAAGKHVAQSPAVTPWQPLVLFAALLFLGVLLLLLWSQQPPTASAPRAQSPSLLAAAPALRGPGSQGSREEALLEPPSVLEPLAATVERALMRYRI